jgi:hypothetical protein
VRLINSGLVLGVILAAPLALASFTEDFESDADTGWWRWHELLPRTFVDEGGNPGRYLQQANEGYSGSSLPIWRTTSTRYQPGFMPSVDSVFTDNWTAMGVNSFSVDLLIERAGVWTERGLTMEVIQMDETGFGVAYDAYYEYPGDFTEVPTGWNRYEFPINASGGIPEGWNFAKQVDGEYLPGSDADWATFMSQIDYVGVGYYKPGYAYPPLLGWTLGIDNITLNTVPEPASLLLMGLGLLLRRR